MSIEHTSWLLPVAREAYKHRADIQSAWQRVTSLLLGKKKSLAMTGVAGVGKTVLFDHLNGTAYKPGYTPPLTSQAVEKGKVSETKSRIRLSVIPGQEAFVRLEAINKLFREGKGVDGVINVVANGFVKIRNSVARQALVTDAKLNTLDKYRSYQIEQELEDLNETCEIVRQAINKHRKPTWMLIAVTKSDLFHDTINEAEEYYSPHGSSAFVERLKRLQAQVGADNFRWDAVPVCAWLENFEWGDEVRPSAFNPQQRDHLLARFVEHLEEYCKS